MTKVMSRIAQFLRFRLERTKTLELTNVLAINLFQRVIVNKRIIAAAALVAGLLVQTEVFAQVALSDIISPNTAKDAAAAADPEKMARKIWRDTIKQNPMPGKGCAHVRYPNVVWEHVDCKVNRRAPVLQLPIDYIASTPGLQINMAFGSFQASGITTETDVGGDKNATHGPNSYTIQLNTNDNSYTAACGDYIHCWVWQQFIYETDPQTGEGYLYMQYWLNNWGSTNKCPNGWTTVDYPSQRDCAKNSDTATLPDIPIANLAEVELYTWATYGGEDGVALGYGSDFWQVTNADSSVPCCKGGLDIATVWNGAEFNVVGNGGGSRAVFSDYPSINVFLSLSNGSESPPQCPQGVITVESNNLTLGTCQTLGYPYAPTIQYNEYIPVPSTPCLSCGGGGGTPPPPPIEP